MKDYETIENMLGTVVVASNYKATMSWLEDYACANDMGLILTTEGSDYTVLRVKNMYNFRDVEFDIIYGAAYGYRITLMYTDAESEEAINNMSAIEELEASKTVVETIGCYSTIAPVDGIMIWNKMMEMYENAFGKRY